MHIDMAGPVHNGERATGYGVGLLYSMLLLLQDQRYACVSVCATYSNIHVYSGATNSPFSPASTSRL